MEFWEIFVPASNRNERFSYAHHKAWDDFVIDVVGGLTVLRGAKGQWVSPDGTLFRDRVIPCRIACTRDQIWKILEFTKSHYNQLAVMAYLVSTEVIIYE